MQYDVMGNTGLLVSRMSLGAWTFTETDATLPSVSKVGPELADRLVGKAIGCGINLFDTSDRYANGQSEIVLGRALRDRRKDVLIATKVGIRNGNVVTDAGLSRRHIRLALEASLKRLGTDWIDFYLVHREDPYTPLEETLEALDEVVRAGMVRYIGFSNWSAWKVAAAISLQRARGLARFTHGQVHYSLLSRDVEFDYLPMAAHFGIGTTIWSPLVMGLLSGKFLSGNGGSSRHDALKVIPIDESVGIATVECLRAIAAGRGVSVSQIALAWLLSKPGVTSIILGATKLDHLTDNVRAFEVHLTAEELADLDRITAGRAPYPVWHAARMADAPVLAALGDRATVRAR